MLLLRRSFQRSTRGHGRFHGGAFLSTEEKDPNWILKLRNARLCWPENDHPTLTVPSLDVHRTGGHAVLGKNGSGKSLLLHALTQPDVYISNASESFEKATTNDTLRPLSAHVTFASHQELLERGGSVQAALGRHLTATSQYLVVRFGLFPLLTRQVQTLSTGEIRKVLILAALAARPRVLVLENVLDGLDVASRALVQAIVDQTVSGFRKDVLVQGITPPPATQVILSTHRSEDLSESVAVVTVCNGGTCVTTARGKHSAQALMADALGKEATADDARGYNQPWYNPELPSRKEIETVATDRTVAPHHEVQLSTGATPALITAKNLVLSGGGKPLLSGISLTIRQGERWLFAGGNGAGKSSLSRLLARAEGDGDNLAFHIDEKDIGWVSTERHLSLVRSSVSTYGILGDCRFNPNLLQVSKWLQMELPECDGPFAELSQGQQKSLLVAEALLRQPKLLILDEITQGLDMMRWHKTLGLVEQWCNWTDTGLIYITHHQDEILPCVSHVLNLEDGKGTITLR